MTEQDHFRFFVPLARLLEYLTPYVFGVPENRGREFPGAFLFLSQRPFFTLLRNAAAPTAGIVADEPVEQLRVDTKKIADEQYQDAATANDRHRRADTPTVFEPIAFPPAFPFHGLPPQKGCCHQRKQP